MITREHRIGKKKEPEDKSTLNTSHRPSHPPDLTILTDDTSLQEALAVLGSYRRAGTREPYSVQITRP